MITVELCLINPNHAYHDQLLSDRICSELTTSDRTMQRNKAITRCIQSTPGRVIIVNVVWKHEAVRISDRGFELTMFGLLRLQNTMQEIYWSN